MNRIFFISMIVSITSLAIPAAKDNASLSTATQKIYAALKDKTPLTKNPLHGYSFGKFASRSYLYFYRAQGYAHMAKNNPNGLNLLEHALADLKDAKSAPAADLQRIETLATDVLKEKVAHLYAQKKHAAVIDAIEQLSAKDRSDSRYVVYYADALFRTSQTQSFKNFARAYHALLSNRSAVEKYLDDIPNWHNVLAPLAVADAPKASQAQRAPDAVFTNSMLLNEPKKILENLDANRYFKTADDLFKLAANLYFTTLKKEGCSAQEKKFIATFRRSMHNFSPAFIDSLIFSFWKRADLKSAELLSLTFLDKFEGHPLYPKVRFNLGRIQEDSKNYQSAAKTYKKFITQSDDATYLELARFRLAWVLYLAKQEKAALPYFEEYVRNYPEGRYASTSEYLLLRLIDKKDAAEQQAQVLAYIKKYPLNFYAFLLADEHNLPNAVLRETLSAENNLAKNRDIQNFKADITTLSRLKIYRELKQFGLNDDAIKVLKSISFDTNNAALNLYLASQFQEMADIHGQVSNLIKVASVPNPHRDLVPWKSLFPNYQFDTIEKVLTQQNVAMSPLLILALIRQESAFDSAARSSASAFGLMQLTEGTAKIAAKQLQLSDFSLFDVGDNLSLGIKHFSELVKKYGRVDYALCAYNAGETPTNLWISLRGHLKPMQFIESIPYPETRIYVKGILRNWAIYRMLYEDKPSPLVSFNSF